MCRLSGGHQRCPDHSNSEVKSKVWYEWDDRAPIQDGVWTIDATVQSDIHLWMGKWAVPGAIDKIKDGALVEQTAQRNYIDMRYIRIR